MKKLQMKKLLCGIVSIFMPPAVAFLVMAGFCFAEDNREAVGLVMSVVSVISVWGVSSYFIYRGTQL